MLLVGRRNSITLRNNLAKNHINGNNKKKYYLETNRTKKNLGKSYE